MYAHNPKAQPITPAEGMHILIPTQSVQFSYQPLKQQHDRAARAADKRAHFLLQHHHTPMQHAAPVPPQSTSSSARGPDSSLRAPESSSIDELRHREVSPLSSSTHARVRSLSHPPPNPSTLSPPPSLSTSFYLTHSKCIK